MNGNTSKFVLTLLFLIITDREGVTLPKSPKIKITEATSTTTEAQDSSGGRRLNARDTDENDPQASKSQNNNHKKELETITRDPLGRSSSENVRGEQDVHKTDKEDKKLAEPKAPTAQIEKRTTPAPIPLRVETGTASPGGGVSPPASLFHGGHHPLPGAWIPGLFPLPMHPPVPGALQAPGGHPSPYNQLAPQGSMASHQYWEVNKEAPSSVLPRLPS